MNFDKGKAILAFFFASKLKTLVFVGDAFRFSTVEESNHPK
jgi:hypothetical protein